MIDTTKNMINNHNFKFGDTIVELTGELKYLEDVHGVVFEVIGNYKELIDVDGMNLNLNYNCDLVESVPYTDYIVLPIGALARPGFFDKTLIKKGLK